MSLDRWHAAGLALAFVEAVVAVTLLAGIVDVAASRGTGAALDAALELATWRLLHPWTLLALATLVLLRRVVQARDRRR